MSNNYPSDQPTLPAGQFSYSNQKPLPNGQPTRKPYQFPGADAQEPTQPVYPQPTVQPTQPVYPQPAVQQTPQQYPLSQHGQPQNAYGGGRRGSPVPEDVPLYPQTQPVKVSLPPRQRPRRQKRRHPFGCLISVLLLVALGVFLFTTGQKVLAFGSAISNQSPLSSQTGYMGGNSRINILILGYGGAGHDGAFLTDSMVIMSLIPSTHHTTLISVPRDLWVQNPANSGNYTKINDVYPVAAGDTNTDPIAGGNAIAQKVSLITGLNVNYWMTINFAGFKDFIDAIGGIDVNVPDGFTAKYPANDDPSVNPNWITVKFTPGQQHMDGATAIVYARARYVLDNFAEGSDFARSQRQQLIMKAALAKLKDWRTWPSLFNAMDKLKQTLYSNLSLADLAAFAQKMDLNGAHHVGLTNDNVLMDATSSDGQDILLPQNDDWLLIPPYIQKQLYN